MVPWTTFPLLGPFAATWAWNHARPSIFLSLRNCLLLAVLVAVHSKLLAQQTNKLLASPSPAAPELGRDRQRRVNAQGTRPPAAMHRPRPTLRRWGVGGADGQRIGAGTTRRDRKVARGGKGGGYAEN